MLCVPIQLFFTKTFLMPWANYTSIIAKYGSLSLPKKHSLILPLRCYHVCVTSQTIKSFYYNDNTKGRVAFPSFIAIEIFYCKYLRAFFIYILLSCLEVVWYCIFKSLVNKIHRIRFCGSRHWRVRDILSYVQYAPLKNILGTRPVSFYSPHCQ